MKKIVFSVIAFIFICFNVTAQEKSNKELKGDKFAFRYSYDKAIDSYTHTKLLSVEGQRNLAECYHKMGQNIESETAYLTLTAMPDGNLPEDYYNYAMVLKINGKYIESNQWMDKFKQLKPEDLRAKDYIANSSDLANMLKDNDKYKIIHQNINTNSEDFGTYFYKSSIVFASSKSSKIFSKKYNWTGKPFFDMYIAKEENGQLKTSENFDKKLNGKLHDGPASFSNDGNYMAFTRNNYDDKTQDKIVELQIWFANYNDEKWSKPEAFIFNNSEYSVGQPCLTSDGKTMYFTSDKIGRAHV